MKRGWISRINRSDLAIGLIVLSILAVGIVTAVVITMDVDNPFGEDDFAASGVLELGEGSYENVVGRGCIGTGGYGDIAGGSQVVIRDNDGKSVAVGELLDGTEDEAAETCSFGFIVDGVPGGHDLYSVEVSHRGEITFREDDAQSISLALG